MSKTFTGRAAVTQRSRGRASAQTTDNPKPAVVGEGVSTSRAPSNRGGSGDTVRRVGVGRTGIGGRTGVGSSTGVGSRTDLGRGAGGGPSRRGAGSRRGVGRGQTMDPYRMNQGTNPDPNRTGMDESPEQDTPQQRATYTKAYTVISPDERKRRQLLEQAELEARQHEQYRQQNKPTSFSYVGTTGGGQSTSLNEARMQQVRSHAQHNKTSRLLQDQERRNKQREAEDRELEEKKMAARRKAEMNTQKLQAREQHLKSDMHRVNQAFLDRLEARTKAASTEQPDSSPQKSQQPTGAGGSRSYAAASNPAGPRTASIPAGQRPAASTSRSSGGAGPRLSQSGVTATSSTFPSNLSRHADHDSRTAAPARVDRRTTTTATAAHSGLPMLGVEDDCKMAADEEFYNNLEIMQNMFPWFDQSELAELLQQCGGSVEQAVQLMEL